MNAGVRAVRGVAGEGMGRVILAGAVLAASFLILFRRGPSGAPAVDRTVVPVAVAPRADLAEDEKATIALFKKASPSVVHITTVAVRQDLWSFNVLEIPEGTGSGFVWDDRGHVVTNYHVIRGGDKARVTLQDQSVWEASVAGTAPDKDLAVLQIEAPRDRLVPIAVGTSHDLQVGQKAFAIGNPFGLDQTLTSGIVSALDRQIESVTRRPIRGVIQTDAAVNPGNSGGPLLDSAGRLIGVNTAIYSPSGASAGIGFAIPVDVVKRVVPQLIARGHLERPILGVTLAEERLARRLGVGEGALVLEVVPGSGAARAGVQPTRRDRLGRIVPGDLIVAVDGKKVASVDDLFFALEDRKVGERVKVTLKRGGSTREVQIELQAAPRE